SRSPPPPAGNPNLTAGCLIWFGACTLLPILAWVFGAATTRGPNDNIVYYVLLGQLIASVVLAGCIVRRNYSGVFEMCVLFVIYTLGLMLAAYVIFAAVSLAGCAGAFYRPQPHSAQGAHCSDLMRESANTADGWQSLASQILES